MLVTHSCLTLCDPINCSLPGYCPWNSPGKNTAWTKLAFSQQLRMGSLCALKNELRGRVGVVMVHLELQIQACFK